jgi:hypothetical protein
METLYFPNHALSHADVDTPVNIGVEFFLGDSDADSQKLHWRKGDAWRRRCYRSNFDCPDEAAAVGRVDG